MLRMIGLSLCLFATGITSTRASLAEELKVSSDFEGGSVRVLSVNAGRRSIAFTPGGDPNRGWPCWWFFRLDGLEKDQTAVLELSGSPAPARNDGRDTGKPLDAGWAMPERAAISSDGSSWRQTDPGERAGPVMRYKIGGTGGPLWVAWGPVFTPKETAVLIAEARKTQPDVEEIVLCKTRSGRPVQGLHFKAHDNPKAPVVWVHARQHAWESGSSWVARGLVEWLVSGEAEAARLRSSADVYVIPIMDVDNVATGNGGKEADPRDHNRDWDQKPVYPEIEAAQARLKEFAKEDRLSLFLDLHNPGPGDKRPFFFLAPSSLLTPIGQLRRERFLEAAARQIKGPLPLAEKPRMTGADYHPVWRQISGVWVTENGNPGTVAACLETSWNTPHSTTEGYRTVGRQLGLTIVEFVRQGGGKEPK